MSTMLEQLYTALSNTLNPNSDIRKSGEQTLNQLSRETNYGFVLLEITLADACDMSARLAAATALKNYIKFVWKEEGEVNLAEDAKKNLRENVFGAMMTAPQQLAKILCEAICIISKYDFPEGWPELIDLIVRAMQTHAENVGPLMSILITLDGICQRYRYEMKSNMLWMEIKLVLDKSAMPLTELFTKYIGFVRNVPDKANDCIEILTKIVSIYHSLLSQDLPEIFEDTMDTWMPGFHALYQLTSVQSSDSTETPLDALWDEMTVVVTLYAQRFEEEIMKYMEKFVELIWQSLTKVVESKRKTQFAKSGINFLSALAIRPQYQGAFEAEGILETLINTIILRNMAYSDEDLELFEDEPVAFFKQDLDGFDKETTRGAAANFLRSLCQRYEKKVVEIITPVISSQMDSYLSSPQNNWKQMDAVCGIILAICSKTETQKFGATSVSTFIDINDFCRRLIIPELTKPAVIPLVAADCLKFFVTFRNQLDPNLIVEFFNSQLAVRFLNPQSNEAAILRLYSAHTVERLLTIPLIRQERSNMNDLFVQFAGLLISDLALPMGIDNCYLLKCLYKCVSYMDNDTLSKKCLEYTSIVSGVLDAALRKSVYVDSLAVHYVFEIICWLIKKSYVLPAGSVDQFYHSVVLPIIIGLFESENRDYVPYGLQLTCALMEQYGHEKEHNPNLQIPTDDFKELYMKLLQSDIWQSSVNVPSFVAALRSYIRWLPDYILSGERVFAMKKLLGKFIMSKINDTHGFLLANELIKYADQVPNFESKDLFYDMLRRVSTAKNMKFTRYLFVFWMRYIAVRGPQKFEFVLEGIQPGCFQMAYNSILLDEGSKDIRHTTSTSEKRSVILGIIHLFRRNYITKDSAVTFINLGVRLIEAFYAVKSSHADDNEDTSIPETADQFNQLANVQLPECFANVDIDFRKEFVRVVYAYITTATEKPNLPDDINNTLRNLKTVAFPGIEPPIGNWDDLDAKLLKLGEI